MNPVIAKNILLFLFITQFYLEETFASVLFNKLSTYKKDGSNHKDLEGAFSELTADQPFVKASYDKFNEDKYATICWNERTTLHIFKNGTNYGYTEYSISLEASTQLAPNKSETSGAEVYEITDNDTKKSRQLVFVTVQSTELETIKQNLTVMCRSGKGFSKSFIDYPERKRVEIKLKPLFQNLESGTSSKYNIHSSKHSIEIKTSLDPSDSKGPLAPRMFSPTLNNMQDSNSKLKATEGVGPRMMSTSDASKTAENAAKSPQDSDITMLPRMLFTNKNKQEISSSKDSASTPDPESKISPRILPGNGNLQPKKTQDNAASSQQKNTVTSPQVPSQNQDLNKSKTVKVESATKVTDKTKSNIDVSKPASSSVLQKTEIKSSPAKISKPESEKIKESSKSSETKITHRILPTVENAQQTKSPHLESTKTIESLPSLEVKTSPKNSPKSQNLQQSTSQAKPEKTTLSSNPAPVVKNPEAKQEEINSKSAPTTQSEEKTQNSQQKEMTHPAAQAPKTVPQNQDLQVKTAKVDGVEPKKISKNDAEKNKSNANTTKDSQTNKSSSISKLATSPKIRTKVIGPTIIPISLRMETEKKNLHREKSNIALLPAEKTDPAAKTKPSEASAENSAKLPDQNKDLEQGKPNATPPTKLDLYSIFPKSLQDYITSIKNKITNKNSPQTNNSQNSAKDNQSTKTSEKDNTQDNLNTKTSEIDNTQMSLRMMPSDYEDEVAHIISVPNNYKELEIEDQLSDHMIEDPSFQNFYAQHSSSFEQTGEEGNVGTQLVNCKNGKVTVKLNMDILKGNSKVKNIAKEIQFDINHPLEAKNRHFDDQLRALVRNYLGDDLYLKNCVGSENSPLEIEAMPRSLQANQKEEATAVNLPKPFQNSGVPQARHSDPDEDIDYETRPFYAISPYSPVKTFYVDETGVYHVVPYNHQPNQPSLLQRLSNNLKTVFRKLTPTDSYSYV
ncbi:probable serine/threonine-protein kinase nek3 [Tribolium castaneum]|uniref:probable serine/threonine-protein kinase nek3 n=1 Tax=Tribolium castaneum TaxID=7070 RepID=UPI0030FE7957